MALLRRLYQGNNGCCNKSIRLEQKGSNFERTVPDYFYRQDSEEVCQCFGCGNETASERAMVGRNLIRESVCYWANEYHVDGFRFDLMGIHDIVTMKEIRKALDGIDLSISYMENGWPYLQLPASGLWP